MCSLEIHFSHLSIERTACNGPRCWLVGRERAYDGMNILSKELSVHSVDPNSSSLRGYFLIALLTWIC